MPRARAALVWGQGLDRATGTLAVDEASFLDVRNLIVRESKLLARGGIVLPATGAALDVVGDIVGIFPMRSINGAVVVGYNRSTFGLTVWAMDGLGGSLTKIGDWATLDSSAPLPIVTGAESFGKMFLSHAEPLFNFRVKTIYYDPSQSPGSQLIDVMGNLDGMGSANVYFRGVYAYLDYMWYYGYGTASDDNRPDILRFSLPGDPANLDPQQYFDVGVKNEAITGLLAMDGNMRIQKRGQAFQITGTNATDFGVFPIEQIYGQINDRMGFPFGAAGVMWSEQGPRMSLGDGTTADISLPLELDGPPPDGLTAQGDEAYAWSVYEPQQRIGLFGFPNLNPASPKTLVYVLSLRTPGVIRWTYYELQQCIYCAGLVVEGAASIGSTLTAYASTIVNTDAGQSGTGRTIKAQWNNNALIGGETAQVFLRPSGGTWSLAASVPATGSTQYALITGNDALLEFDTAVRFVKSGFATSGYQSSNPDDWTASTAPGAKGTVTTLCSNPTALAGVWSRIGMTTHQIVFAFAQPEQNTGYDLEQSDDGVGGWTTVDVVSDPYNDRTITLATTDALLGLTKYYRLRAKRGSNVSGYSNVATVYVGPMITPDLLAIVQAGTDQTFHVWLRQTIPGVFLEVQTSPDGSTWSSQYLSDAYTAQQNVLSPIALGSPTHVRSRYVVRTFGVNDAGTWVVGTTITLTNNAVPSPPTSGLGVWVNPNAVALGFDDPGTGLGTMAQYARMSDQLPALSSIVASPGVEIDLSDIRDLGDEAGGYVANVTFATLPMETVQLYTVDTSGGQRKVSTPAAVQIVMTFDGPTAVGVVTASLGQITVSWDNNYTSGNLTLAGWWDGVSGAIVNAIAGLLSMTGPSQSLTGPITGLVALPANGTTILVRVVHFSFSGNRWSTFTDVPWVVGT